MFSDPTRSLIGLILCALSVWGLATHPIQAQDQPGEQDEIKAIFRISKQFLGDVADKEIVAEIPLLATVMGFRCTGVIHGHGKVSVDLQSSGDAATFSVDSRGKGYACVTGVRGPLVAVGPARGPFTSHTLVRFDGRQFTHVRTTACAKVHGELQRVTGLRDGPFGRVIGAGMKPLAKKRIPLAEAKAKPIAECYLRRFVEGMADRIITRLNEKTPVEESVTRLFPETKDWIFHMSSDDEFIQAAFGPPDVEVPTLPDVRNRRENVRLEVWLRSTNNEAKLLGDLSKKPLARQLVQTYLELTLPKLAALAQEPSVTAMGSWIVIRVGAPKAE